MASFYIPKEKAK